MPEQKQNYDRTAKILHWLSAIFFIGALLMGLYFSTLDYRNDKVDYAKFGEWIYWHKTLGVLVFLLVFYRLYHRFRHPPPPLPPGTSRWIEISANISHISLYALILILGFSGLVASDIGNYPVKLFELWYIPQFPAENRPLADGIFKVHMFLGDVAAGLLAIHIGASLYHHYIVKDSILARMLPGKRGDS
jgi:cytochrome b561